MKLVPTVVFGLGTTGLRTLNYLRQMIYECLGVPEFPLIRLIGLESSPEGMELLEREACIPKSKLREYPDSILFWEDSARGRERLAVDFKHYHAWPEWWKIPLHDTRAGLCGAEQYRVIGRFLFENFFDKFLADATQPVAEILRQEHREPWYHSSLPECRKILETHGLIGKDKTDYSEFLGSEPQVNVLFVGTLCGGTCSSFFLNLPLHVKKHLGLNNNRIVSYGLFAIPQDNSSMDISVINAVSALKEYEALYNREFFDSFVAIKGGNQGESVNLQKFINSHPLLKALFPDRIREDINGLAERLPYDYFYLRSAGTDDKNEFQGHIPYQFSLYCLLKFLGLPDPSENAGQGNAGNNFIYSIGSFNCAGLMFPVSRVAYGTSSLVMAKMINKAIGGSGLHCDKERMQTWILEDIKLLGDHLANVEHGTDYDRSNLLNRFFIELIQRRFGFSDDSLGLRQISTYVIQFADACSDMPEPKSISPMPHIEPAFLDNVIGISLDEMNRLVDRCNEKAERNRKLRLVKNFSQSILNKANGIAAAIDSKINILKTCEIDNNDNFETSRNLPSSPLLRWVFVRKTGRERWDLLMDGDTRDNFTACVTSVSEEENYEKTERYLKEALERDVFFDANLDDDKPKEIIEDVFRIAFDDLFDMHINVLRKLEGLVRVFEKLAKHKLRQENNNLRSSAQNVQSLGLSKQLKTPDWHVTKAAEPRDFYIGSDNPGPEHLPDGINMESETLFGFGARNIILYLWEEFYGRNDFQEVCLNMLNLVNNRPHLYERMLSSYSKDENIFKHPRYGHIHDNPKIVTLTGWKYTLLEDAVKSLSGLNLSFTGDVTNTNNMLPENWWDLTDMDFETIRRKLRKWYSDLSDVEKNELIKIGSEKDDLRLGALWRVLNLHKESTNSSIRDRIIEYIPFKDIR